MLLQKLARPNLEQKKEAVHALLELEADSLEMIRQKFEEFRRVPAHEIYNLVQQARKSTTQHGDLLQVLLSFPSHPESAFFQKVALTVVSLLHTLAHIGTTPAIGMMLTIVDDYNSAFQEEIEQIVQMLDDRSVAALIETRRNPNPKVRRWSYSQLEAMNKRLPINAVQTKSNQFLADILRAFGNIHDMDAVELVLSFANSDRVQVRTAARESIYTYGQHAIWKLRETYLSLTEQNAPERWSAHRLAKKIFSTYDLHRLKSLHSLLDAALEQSHTGRIEESIKSFDKILSKEPSLARRAEMAPIYLQHAHSLEEKKPEICNALPSQSCPP